MIIQKDSLDNLVFHVIKIRGAIGTFNQVAITFGIFVSMILGLNDILGSENRWPILIGSTIVPSILQALLLLMIPESPRHVQ